MRNFSLSMICLSMLVISCSYNSEDDLTESMNTIELVNYEENIKVVIDNNCIGCHNNPPINGAPMPLTTYENVKNAIENRGLINRISSTDTGFLMPFGGPRLPQNSIDFIIQWEADGLLEN